MNPASDQLRAADTSAAVIRHELRRALAQVTHPVVRRAYLGLVRRAVRDGFGLPPPAARAAGPRPPGRPPEMTLVNKIIRALGEHGEASASRLTALVGGERAAVYATLYAYKTTLFARRRHAIPFDPHFPAARVSFHLTDQGRARLAALVQELSRERTDPAQPG